ncbi:MAG: hypothetical protein WC714_28565 [Candidatus Obscuribacterales bacterium]|jgi:hypothetical protein
MGKSTIIRIGDKFKKNDTVYEVIGTRPGGIVDLLDRAKTRFTMRQHSEVKLWDRVSD